MTDLLDLALTAHGGLDRWQALTGLVVRGGLGGPFWGSKGWPDVYRDVRVSIDTRNFDITFDPFPGPDRRSRMVAGPEIIDILAADDALVERRIDPRSSFPAPETRPPWDAIQTAYFTSCAMWNYLSTPYVLARPGVQVSEIDPWEEDGERWRRLAVQFPTDLPNHNPDQTFYFGSDGLLRRLDYHPEVTAAPIAHYVDEYGTFDGFAFPTRRSVYVREPDGTARKSSAVITIHLDDVHAV
jgi:hypothetical protein